VTSPPARDGAPADLELRRSGVRLSLGLVRGANWGSLVGGIASCL
jgi:hypothetical protein